MADCREQVYSDEFFDFIVSYEETNEQTIAGTCIQRIDEGYDIFYYPREGLPPLSVGSYSYSEIPKCYGLLDQTALSTFSGVHSPHSVNTTITFTLISSCIKSGIAAI